MLKSPEALPASAAPIPAVAMAGLTFEELRRYAVCVAVPAGHRLAGARKLTLKQLLNERLITYSRADYHDYHVMIAQLFAPLKRQPEIAEEHHSATNLIASVGAGRGVAFVSRPSPASLAHK